MHARRRREALRAVALNRYARLALGGALVLHAIAFVWVVAGRITFPYDLEWMAGSVLDHVERVRAGQPVYVEPSAGFIPFLYPPLYYWICALLGGSTLACRLVSVASTFAELGLAVVIARALGASRTWSYIAAALVLACYRYVGWWYDLERADVLAAAFALGGAAVVLRATRARGLALAGAVFAAGCLAKQQVIFSAAGAGFGLLLSVWRGKDRRSLGAVVTFGATFAIVVVALFAYAIHREGPWLRYYVLDMPRAHGVIAALVLPTLAHDLGTGFALAAVTFAALWLLARRLDTLGSRDIVFACILLASFAGAVSSRLHIGGWINVLQPWSSFAAIAIAVAASRFPSLERGWIPLVAQLAIWFYDPTSPWPPKGCLEGMRASRDLVHKLEQEGEVLAPATGHVTTPRHFHVSALADVARVDGHVPRELVDKIESRAYAGIVDGARASWAPDPMPDWPPVLLEDFTDLKRPLLRNYFISEKLDESAGNLALASPNHPVWVYRPRKKPLGDVTNAELRRRQLEEMRLAAEGRRAPGEIEDLAAR